tara:strand:+ start:216 stop:455 length:240 start_codon:yes stop_codon:yes gene_type:complete
MSSISIALLLALSAYIVALLGDTFKRNLLILIPIMISFDTVTVFTMASIIEVKLTIAVGVMAGTMLKVIVFILYQKYRP